MSIEPSFLDEAVNRQVKRALDAGRPVMLFPENGGAMLGRLHYSYPHVTLYVPKQMFGEYERRLQTYGARRRASGVDSTPTPGEGIKVR